jgi:ferredoxin
VDCFYQDDTLLYIHPDDCIDCEACVPECPIEAIYAQSAVPTQWKSFVKLNLDKATALKESKSGHMTQDCKQKPKKGPGCTKLV